MKNVSFFLRAKFALERYKAHFFRTDLNDQYLQEQYVKELKPQGEGKKIEIDRVDDISPKDFRENYLLKNKPLLITNAAKNWDCYKTWTLDTLDAKYGDDKIPIMDTIPDEDLTFNVNDVTLSDIISAMKSGDNSKYARFNGLLHSHPELLNDLDLNYIYKRRNILCSGNTFQVFMGPGGSKTDIHAAPGHNLFTQAIGTKRWYLLPACSDPFLRPVPKGSTFFPSQFDPRNPDYDRYPAMKYIDYYDFEHKAGEILYFPSSWWHYVENQTPVVGFAFRWFGVLSSPIINFSQVLLTITAYNPPLFFMLRNKKDYSKVFKFMHEKKNDINAKTVKN